MINLKQHLLPLFCVLAFAGTAVSARAQTYLSTVADSRINNWVVATGGFTDPVAQKFTLGSQSESIGFVAVQIDSQSQAGANFAVSIHSDSAGSPGALVSNGLLSGPAQPTVNALVNYTASGLTLAANTSYWLEFTNTTSSAVYVSGTSSTTYTSSDGWTLPATTDFSFNGGAFWSATSEATPLFSINAAPEPGSILLLTLGVGAILGGRRRRAVAGRA
jgi:hypothetical protein